MLDRYRRRLCRSQVYCTLAVLGSIRLLMRCRWDADDLLHIFDVEHQVLFTMAVGHWLVAVWEDMQCWRLLGAGMDSSIAGSMSEESTARFLGQAYVVHHIVAALCFWGVVRLQSCVGIGLFGLLFELPVLWMNHREFAVCMEPKPAWLRNRAKLYRFWRDLMLMFVVGRFGPAFVYTYSVVFWQRSLCRMSVGELVVYHLAALFFLMLNRALGNMLEGWKKSDFEAMHRALKTWDYSREDPLEAAAHTFEVSDELERAIWGGALNGAAVAGGKAHEEEPPPPTLRDIPEAEFYVAKGAEYAEGKVWIEIDGSVYDVSGFLKLHPGGAGPLRKYGGKDATEAFHRTRHSMHARKLMQQHAIGRLVRPTKTYRIFELGIGKASKAGWGLFTGVVYLGMSMPRSAFGWQLEIDEGSHLLRLVLPGLMFSTMIGMVPMTGCNFLAKHCTLQSVCLGVAFMLQCIGFFVARRELPDDLPWSCPSGVELAAVAMFVGEELFDLRDARFFSKRSFLAAVVLVCSWSMRGANRLLSEAPEHLLGAAVLASGVLLMAHSAKDRGFDSMTEVIPALACTGLLGCMVLGVLYCTGPEVAAAIRGVQQGSWFSIVVALPAACMAAVSSYDVAVRFAMTAGGPWIARCTANLCMIAAFLFGGWTNGYWLTWAGLVAHNAAVAYRYRHHQEELEASGEFEHLPEMVHHARSFWDHFRAVPLAATWTGALLVAQRLLKWILPEELTAYGYDLPIFALGGTVDYGVAAYFAPPRARREKEAPKHFDVQVKHVDTTREDGEQEALARARSMRASWREILRADPAGLSGNVLMMFPSYGGNRAWKDINLTSWSTERSALDWAELRADKHAEEPGGGDSAAFEGAGSSMNMVLKPRGPLRHQDRCKSCYRLVESMHVGLKAPEKCAACKGKTYGYTFF